MADWFAEEPLHEHAVEQRISIHAGLHALMCSIWAKQQGHLFHWVPVFLAFGVGIYFAQKVEPSLMVLGLCACAAGSCAITGWRRSGAAAAFWIACALIFAGFSVAGLRTYSVSAPVLDFRYYGPVQGRVVGLDRSGSGAPRLALDQVVLQRMSHLDTPDKIRVSLLGERAHDATFAPGDTVMLTGHLMPPNGPAEPGGFDFRRYAWFQKMGAFGYTRSPVLRLQAAQDSNGSLNVYLARIRKTLSDKAFDALGGARGGFAAVIISGDRRHLDLSALEDLRAANLAHLLAISGLHMGLLTGSVFGALRFSLLLFPGPRHVWPIKQVAAIGAMLAATCYLLISGASVATERAWVMVMVALLAILVNRRALSLRAVALAALVVLVLRPEALLSPGFQMSFAATTALVVVFDRLRDVPLMARLPNWLRPFVSLLVSSFVAGLATAPVAMVHFNMVAHYGYIANLTALPVMGVLVMPMAVVSVLAMPFGLEQWPLAVMGLGLDWILFVASKVSSWSGAVGYVASPPAAVLPLMASAALFFLLWQGYIRWAGALAMACAAALWAGSDRPDVLISQDGGQIGIMTPQGRAVSKSRGAGFVTGIWLENDGAPMEQNAAAELWPGNRDAGRASASVLGLKIVHIQGKRSAQSVLSCAGADILVANVALPELSGCLVLTPDMLRDTGAVTITGRGTGAGPKITTASEITGRRLWSVGAPQGVRLYPRDQ